MLVGESRDLLVAGDLLPPEVVYSDDSEAAELNVERIFDYVFEDTLLYHGTPVFGG